MNKRFTVIIPEHNRPERLKRLLDYLLSKDCQIVVSDSSNERFKYEHLFKDRIEYVFLPQSQLAEKLVAIEKIVKTPYVVMCADDDFVIPATVNKIIDFLDAHPDYSSGQGLYAFYDTSTILYEAYPQLYSNSLSENDSKERVLHLGKNYYQFYYAVYRKDLFFETFKKIVNIDGCSLIKNLCILEMYMALYGAASSKHIVVNDLFNVREYIKNSAGHWVTNLHDLLANNQCNEEINTMYTVIDSLIHNNSGELSISREAVKLYCAKKYMNTKKIKHLLRRIFKKIFFLCSQTKRNQFLWNNFVEKWNHKQEDMMELNAILSYFNQYKSATIFEDN